MGMTQDEKETLLDELSITKRKAQKLTIRLRFQGEETEAAKIIAKSGRLSDKIDRLLARHMSDWIGSAETATQSLSRVNKDIQKVIRDVKKQIDAASQVVKALGYLDEAIKIATDLLA